MDDLKLCPSPLDISWNPGVTTSKLLCASTVAFRPGSHVSDNTSTPSVDVSIWDDMNTNHSSAHFLKELDSPIDLTGHILSPLYTMDFNYQGSRFHSIAHLMCHRHTVVAGQKTFATTIRKWSKHLVDIPTPKFKTLDWQRQWRSLLIDIYSHLCLTDMAFKTALIDTGPRPFTLHCSRLWGDIHSDSDTDSRANAMSDILVDTRVRAMAGNLTPCRWLIPGYSRPGLQNAAR